MTFAAPFMLALGAFIAVPLILHLFQRHQGARVVFPALRYLRRAEEEHAKRIRLRQLVLLAVRVLAVALIAAAAARAFLPGAGAAHEPTAVVLILDNSLSSGAVIGSERVLDRLEAAALATLARGGPEDAFWLIRAGEPWTAAVAGDAETVAAAVGASEPSDGGADLGAELRRAASILQGSEQSAREIHVFSDLQAEGVPAEALVGGDAAGAGIVADGDSVRIVLFDPGVEAPPNRGITAVAVGGGLAPRVGERSTVTFEVTGGAADGDSVQARLVIGGNVRAVGQVPVGASVLPFPARPQGPVAGYVEIDRDALAADDRRYFAVDVVPAPAVAYPDTLPFLAEALRVLADAGRVRAGPEPDVRIAPGGLGSESVLDGVAVLVLPPASPLELTAANRRLAAARIPWRFEPAPGVERLDPVSELGAALDDAQVRDPYSLTPTGLPGTGQVRIRLRSGRPWAVTGRVDAGGRYAVLGSPLTPEAGTLVTSAALIPLLDHALNRWLAGERTGETSMVGDRVDVPGADSVAHPDGAVEPIRGDAFRPLRAGVHTVYAGDAVAYLPVNPPAAESFLARVEPTALREAGVRVAGIEDWPAAIFGRRLGQEATIPLLILLVAVLLVESGVAASGRRG